MERLLIEDKWNVLTYDIMNYVKPMLQANPILNYDGQWLSVHLTNEEDAMLVIRFLVVNGRSFSYKFESEPNHDA